MVALAVLVSKLRRQSGHSRSADDSTRAPDRLELETRMYDNREVNNYDNMVFNNYDNRVFNNYEDDFFKLQRTAAESINH